MKVENIESVMEDAVNALYYIVKNRLELNLDKKWAFKGKINYNNLSTINFELRYSEEYTFEKYLIQGVCTIGETISIHLLDIDFEDIDKENEEYYFSFKLPIIDKGKLKEIENLINRLLIQNRSYKYFLEDYNRYLKNNPFEYIKSLITDGLIDFEEKIYDEISYRYMGEFGEDSIDIFIDNDESEEEYIVDHFSVNVADRFLLEYEAYQNNQIRELKNLITKPNISINDFLIRTDNRKCIYKEHHLQRIKALVCVDDGQNIKEELADANYCQECNRFYMSEIEYERLCRIGRICCRVITYTEYRQIVEQGFQTWANKSLLRSYGYTVSAQEGLGEKERQRILSFVIENNIMQVDEVINFIEWLVNRNRSEKYYQARQKWISDIAFIRNYKLIYDNVKVRDIYRIIKK